MAEIFSLTSVKKTRHRFKPAKALGFLSKIILAFVVFEVLWFWMLNFTAKPICVQWGTIEKGFWTEALFLRNETVLTAGVDGQAEWISESGIRVPKGVTVARITPSHPPGSSQISQASQTIQQEFQALLIEEERLRQESERVEDEAGLWQKRWGAKSLSHQAREEFELIKKEKERVFRSIQDIQTKAAVLRGKLQNLSFDSGTIISPVPGVLFFQYDEWEEKLTPHHFSHLTKADFERDYPLRVPEKRIQTGNIIGKIIHPFQEIIAVHIKSTELQRIPEPGQTWWIKSASGLKEITLRTVKVTDRQGEMILGFDDTNSIALFAPERQVKVYLVYQRITGITVPVHAVIKQNGVDTVRVVRRDGYYHQKVKVVASDGEKTIVEGIDFGTTIISR